MSKSVPDEWEYSKISESSVSVSKKFNANEGDNPRYIGLEHIAKNTKYLRQWGYAADVISTQGVFQVGDTLFGKLRPYLSKVSIADFDGICSTDILVIRALNGTSSEFLYRILSSEDAISYAVESSAGNVMPRTSWKAMAEFIFLKPPLPEQQKIAQILTSVDEVIEKTQAQIDKLKDLKTAMMQELMTKGIGHVEFKDSPVGMIPVGWEVKTIEDLNISVLDGDRGKEYPKEKDFFQHEHCLFLSAKNVTKKGFRFDVSMFITEKKDNAMRKGKLKRGDIVITTRGTLGNIAYFNAEIPFENVRINSGMAIIRNDKTAVSTEFLNILLHSPLVNEQTELLAFGSAIPQLTIGLLKNLNIPVPSIEEQNKISAMINLVSHKIILIESKLTSLKNTKKALMQDLLTGKVRVNTEQSNPALAVG